MNVFRGGLELELFGGQLHDFGIRSRRRLAEIAEHHFAVTVGDFLPRTLHHIAEGLLEVELGDRSDRSAVTALGHHFAHRTNRVIVLVETIVVAHHLRVGRQRAAGHRREDDLRTDFHRFRRNEILTHAIFKDLFGLENLVRIDPHIIIGAAQTMPHHEDIGFAGAAGHRAHRQVDDVGAGFDRSHVAGHRAAGGIMGVELNIDFVAEQRAGLLDGFVNDGRGGGSGRILERHTVKRNAVIENVFQGIDIEFRRVGIAFGKAGRQAHHGHRDLMLAAVFGDAAAGNREVAHIIERIEVADGGDAVLFEQFGVQIDHVGGLADQADDVGAAAQRLQIDLRTDHFTALVHHIEGIFLTIEVKALKPGAAADFEVVDPGLPGRRQRGQEIFGFDARTDAGLEAVPEGAVHETHFFHCKGP
ncbi:hypothetical protein SDC9_117879 [bioreactor metagenome]|uniref:NAD-specific glutamate dehydrogenase n=1 Tax=bioreactor metagenome TaxID=1076179 RepID=A0A645C0R5_9ZZZZ